MRCCWLTYILFISEEFCRNFPTYCILVDKIEQLKSVFFCKRKLIHENIRANYFSPLTLSWSVLMKITGDSLYNSSMDHNYRIFDLIKIENSIKHQSLSNSIRGLPCVSICENRQSIHIKSKSNKNQPSILLNCHC